MVSDYRNRMCLRFFHALRRLAPQTKEALASLVGGTCSERCLAIDSWMCKEPLCAKERLSGQVVDVLYDPTDQVQGDVSRQVLVLKKSQI